MSQFHLLRNFGFLVAYFVVLRQYCVRGQAWQGCIDPDKNNNNVYVSQRTRVCFSVANTTDWSAGVSYIRASFEPQADVYSRFQIPNSYRDLVLRRNLTDNFVAKSPTITVGAASQTALSFLKVYYDAAKDHVFPFFTAIIEVKKGVVQGITWDDGCVFCGGTECLENTYNYDGVPQNKSSAGQVTRTCFLTTEDCNQLSKSNSSTTTCDLTFYVVWSGTDANGLAMQSQAYRFSAFPPQELSDRLTQLLIPDSAADLFNNRNVSQRQLLLAESMAQSYEHHGLLPTDADRSSISKTEGRDL